MRHTTLILATALSLANFALAGFGAAVAQTTKPNADASERAMTTKPAEPTAKGEGSERAMTSKPEVATPSAEDKTIQRGNADR